MTARSRRCPRRALALSILLALPGLAGMASFGSCAGDEGYTLTLDLPPRRAPAGIDTIAVQDFAPDGRGASFAQHVRRRLASEGLVQPVASGGMAELRGRVDVGEVRTTQESETRPYRADENELEVVKTFTFHRVRKQLTVAASYELQMRGQLVAGDRLVRRLDQTWEGATPEEALASAPSDESLEDTLLAQLVDELVRDVAPHRETRSLPLVTGASPALRSGITQLREGRLDQAFETWNGVVASSDDPADRAAAYYDMGLVREARGEYEDAFVSFANAEGLMPADPAYVEARARAERSLNEQRALAPSAFGVAAPPRLTPSARLHLTITPDPSWARVRIMNIAPAYQPGIELAPGSYDVLVDAEGYRPHRQWVDLQADTSLEVRLTPR